MKEDFITKETTRKAAIEELEKMIRQMKEESIKVNVNLELRKSYQVYRDQMERHQTTTELPHPLFSCATLHHLQTQIAEFGELTMEIRLLPQGKSLSWPWERKAELTKN